MSSSMLVGALDAIERPSILGPDPEDRRDDDREQGRAHVGGAPTLDDLLTGTWDALLAGRPAACLLCDDPLEPRYGAGHSPVAGSCLRCGAELS